MSTDQTPTSTPYLIADGRDADGAPILLVPGFWLGSWCWTEVALALAARGRRAVAVDLAGHGLRARRRHRTPLRRRCPGQRTLSGGGSHPR